MRLFCMKTFQPYIFIHSCIYFTCKITTNMHDILSCCVKVPFWLPIMNESFKLLHSSIRFFSPLVSEPIYWIPSPYVKFKVR